MFTKATNSFLRQTSSRLKYRNHSSNAAAVAFVTNESDDESEVTNARPRLEALRRQLQRDRESTPKIQLSKHKGPIQAKATPALSSDLDELIRQLDALPLPHEPLTDKFGRQHSYLRISLSEKCNLRCLYCMPEDGVPVQPQSHLLNNDEIIQLATWFVKQGVDKVRLTGGEPLLRKDLVDLVGRLNQLGLDHIGMTTNGVTLSKHLPDLVAAGLTHVNVSLDSLEPEKFARLTRRPPSYHTKVIQAIEDCASMLPYRTKINCVVLPDNANELADFAELTRHLPVDVRFIEYMPFNDNLWQSDGFVSYQQMQDKIQGLQRLEDGPNDTTKWWTLPPVVTHGASSSPLGRIGFITSMSEHFCGTCNRLRLTADGKLKVCLFGKTEVSLRDLLRNGASEETLQKLIHHSVQKKHFKLGGHKDMEDLRAHSTENRPMTLIGG